MSNNIDKCRQISPFIDKYRQNRQISKFIDSYRHTLSKRLGGQHLGEKNKPPRKPRWKTRERIPRPNMSCSFFFFLVSWLNSFLGQKFQMRRGAQTGGMKKFWEFFFDFSKKFGNTSIRKIMQKTFFQFSLQFTHHHSRFSQLCQVQNGGIPI